MTETSALDGGIITETLDDLVRDLMSDSEEAVTYLRSRFLSGAALSLWQARKDAGFTQAEVADRLATTQSAIARLEKDTSGSMSLHRYVDYALACGKLPFVLELAPVETLRGFVKSHPDEAAAAVPVASWLQTGFLAVNAAAYQAPNVQSHSFQCDLSFHQLAAIESVVPAVSVLDGQSRNDSPYQQAANSYSFADQLTAAA